LLNGSDYPLPGVVPLTSPRQWAKAGLLDDAAVPVLNEIQNYNPLLFDFVLKRSLRAGKHSLAVGIFHTRDFFLRIA
jgi:mannonate dehydratase